MGRYAGITFLGALNQVIKGGFYASASIDREGKQRTDQFSLIQKNKGINVATFNFAQLPGCCGVGVLYYISPRGDKETATKWTALVLDTVETAAKRAGYGALMLSQKTGSTITSVLTARGYTTTERFRNAKTNNLLEVFIKDLKQPEPKPATTYLDVEGE